MEKEFAYRAFISYSRKDTALVDKLHRYLESYRVPRSLRRQLPHLPPRLRPIFLDRAELPIGALSAVIREGLETSEYLIVVCSRHSAVPNDTGMHWVNQEVEEFIRLHGGKTDKVIPIISRDWELVQEGAHQVKRVVRPTACFPPALVARSPQDEERNIHAADIHESGWARACNDVLAKMLGVRPDALWRRHRREQLRLWYSIGSIVLILLLALSWWSWDYYVSKETCYADYVECEAEPRGIGELTEAEAASVPGYYRFTTRKHRLCQVEYCDGAGKRSVPQAGWDAARPALMRDFAYAVVDGTEYQLTHRSHCDISGKAYAWLMSPHACSQCLPGGGASVVPAQEKFLREAEASVARRGYLVIREGEKPMLEQAQMQGFESYCLGCDAEGRIVKIDHYNEKGELSLNQAGWASVVILHQKDGFVQEKRYYGVDGQLRKNRQGYATVHIQREEKRLTRVAFRDERGQACELANGAASIEWQYDAEGRYSHMLFRDARNLSITPHGDRNPS